ncbi:hypothetical protein, partial [Caldalkalibacillus mannanilyticus]|uniref:hypothetical protein n=1 Tax=Caldalkalibacillus mannanilyticus TaxID=1418 RepID=UPI0005505649
MRKKRKSSFIIMLALTLMWPFSVYAEAEQKQEKIETTEVSGSAHDQEELDRVYGPAKGSATIYSYPLIEGEDIDKFWNTHLWSAKFNVETGWQIPKTIRLSSGKTTVYYNAKTSTNTGTNTKWKLRIEKEDGWIGGWSHIDTHENLPVNGLSIGNFSGLKSNSGWVGNEYR